MYFSLKASMKNQFLSEFKVNRKEIVTVIKDKEIRRIAKNFYVSIL